MSTLVKERLSLTRKLGLITTNSIINYREINISLLVTRPTIKEDNIGAYVIISTFRLTKGRL